MSDHKEGFLKGDIVVLGQDTGWKVVMEEIIEVGKHFILYKVNSDIQPWSTTIEAVEACAILVSTTSLEVI